MSSRSRPRCFAARQPQRDATADSCANTSLNTGRTCDRYTYECGSFSAISRAWKRHGYASPVSSLTLAGTYGKLRLRLSRADDKPAYVPVTDLRYVETDHKTIGADVVAHVGVRMRRGVESYLMLGLARAFLREGDDRER